MPVDKESKVVSNKQAQKDQIASANERAKIQVEADKAQDQKAKELDKKFGGAGRSEDKKKNLERMKDISKLLRDSIKKTEEAKTDLGDFSLALQEKRADLPNKKQLTVEEFNDWMNDLSMILQERDRAAQSSEDTLMYVIEKIRHDSVA